MLDIGTRLYCRDKDKHGYLRTHAKGYFRSTIPPCMSIFHRSVHPPMGGRAWNVPCSSQIPHYLSSVESVMNMDSFNPMGRAAQKHIAWFEHMLHSLRVRYMSIMHEVKGESSTQSHPRTLNVQLPFSFINLPSFLYNHNPLRWNPMLPTDVFASDPFHSTWLLILMMIKLIRGNLVMDEWFKLLCHTIFKRREEKRREEKRREEKRREEKEEKNYK